MQKKTIVALVLALIASNLWLTYRLLDAGITQTYISASQELTAEALAQTLAILPVVAKPGSTRGEVIAAARTSKDSIEPYEKEGYVWVGQLGLQFDSKGQFIKAVAGYDQ